MSVQPPGGISGVTTSTACFIGKTIRGPVCNPQLCLSYSDFDFIFGSDSTYSDTAQAVSLFFLNGGTQCWVTRIVNDDGPSQISDYEDAFAAVDEHVNLFNFMVLSRDKSMGASPTRTFYGMASIYCQKRKAFLIMDPPAEWVNIQQVNDPVLGINSLRNGLVKDSCGVYFPNLIITNSDGSQTETGPAGAIAGIMARIDDSYGVWKAPAGINADLKGISGLKLGIKDSDNELLNSVGINAIRGFPDGIFCWGARTLDGDDSFASDWKYIPVRRTALFIEESLNEGLNWVVFEPNGESLWEQIRLGVGAFMYDLFREGALQGTKPDEAFFVKCDSDTTTQIDINNGIVNIEVGFAPLQPAEFIILNLQLIVDQPNGPPN